MQGGTVHRRRVGSCSASVQTFSSSLQVRDLWRCVGVMGSTDGHGRVVPITRALGGDRDLGYVAARVLQRGSVDFYVGVLPH